jgi:prevent-host-death family protein
MLFSLLRDSSDMHQVNIEDAKTHLPDLIDAAVNGEEVVITKDDQHIVKLVPVARAKPRPQFGSAKGLITMSDDFDEPLEDFEEYMK